jgi:ParB family transcriptional regulator, chromosome partitioning protein
MGIGKRLQDLTADLKDLAPPVESGQTVQALTTPVPPTTHADSKFPPAVPGVLPPRTGPGQMLAFRGQVLAAEAEAATLRARLEEYEDSFPARKIDPNSILQSRWANRHPSSYSTPQFTRLKSDIEQAGGNVQPILVRQLENKTGAYEIVFGHRRHQACKELGMPVLAVIWPHPLTDAELFSAMDRENRERADLSPYEQGMMYLRALEENLYPSQRRLAEALGVSHTWVRKALVVAELPQPVVECFKSPLDIQYRHAEKLAAALEANRKAVLKRAEKIRGQRLSSNEVTEMLVEPDATLDLRRAMEITALGKPVGQYFRDKSGSLVIKLNADVVPAEQLDSLIQQITKLLS